MHHFFDHQRVYLFQFGHCLAEALLFQTPNSLHQLRMIERVQRFVAKFELQGALVGKVGQSALEKTQTCCWISASWTLSIWRGNYVGHRGIYYWQLSRLTWFYWQFTVLIFLVLLYLNILWSLISVWIFKFFHSYARMLQNCLLFCGFLSSSEYWYKVLFEFFSLVLRQTLVYHVIYHIALVRVWNGRFWPLLRP